MTFEQLFNGLQPKPHDKLLNVFKHTHTHIFSSTLKATAHKNQKQNKIK